MSLKDTLAGLKKAEEDRIQFEKDTPEIIREWVSSIAGLYAEISGWISEYIENETIKISRSKITINDERLGPYEVSTLEISAGAKQVILEPKARYLIGAGGLIDLKSIPNKPGLKVSFIRTRPSDSAPWSWGIQRLPPQGTSRPITGGARPQQNIPRLEPLNKASFEDALNALLK